MITPIRHIPLFPDWCTYSAENFLYINSFTHDVLSNKTGTSDWFSVFGINGNEWYVSFIINNMSIFKRMPLLKVVQVDKLIEDEIIELKLKCGRLLIVSHINGNLFTQYNDIVCTNYICLNPELKAMNLLTVQKFDCVVFNGTFQDAIINFVQNNSLLRYRKMKNVSNKFRRYNSNE